eukprot:1650059-Rhodomonas_salina.1
MPLLEIFNSLLVTFVLTEVVIRERSAPPSAFAYGSYPVPGADPADGGPRKPHDLKPYFVLLVVPNLLLS